MGVRLVGAEEGARERDGARQAASTLTSTTMLADQAGDVTGAATPLAALQLGFNNASCAGLKTGVTSLRTVAFTCFLLSVDAWTLGTQQRLSPKT